MNDVAQTRTASILTFLVGGWLMLSPIWISISGWALTTLLVAGGVIALAGLVQLFTENSLPSWLTALAAIVLFVAAFTFNDVSSSVIWNEAVAAAVAFVLAIWDAAEVAEVHNKHHRPGAI